jgi:hypothetical protein
MILSYFSRIVVVVLSFLLLLHFNYPQNHNNKIHFVHSFTTSSTTTTFTRNRQQPKSFPLSSSSSSELLFNKKFDSNDDNHQQQLQEGQQSSNTVTLNNRRNTIVKLAQTSISVILLGNIQSANALVKGNVPPPKMSASSSTSDRPKCTNIDECQAQAEIREQQIREQQRASELDSSTYPIQTTKSGTRYRDYIIVDNNTNDDNNTKKSPVVVKDGDTVELYYKVLKLGKRSYDGISGEGTVVFSCGYGYEDYETKPRSNTFTTTIGSPYNIASLNDAIIGMKGIGSIRRFSIVPDKGWRKPGKLCDGGPGGQGTGGELRTDYVVVPTATIVETEKCFDQTKQPFPISFAQQRRMAQRFDQSLIMEIELVNIIQQ